MKAYLKTIKASVGSGEYFAIALSMPVSFKNEDCLLLKLPAWEYDTIQDPEMILSKVVKALNESSVEL